MVRMRGCVSSCYITSKTKTDLFFAQIQFLKSLLATLQTFVICQVLTLMLKYQRFNVL